MLKFVRRVAAATRMAELTLEKVLDYEFETVVAPAMGGLVIGQEIARQTETLYLP